MTRFRRALINANLPPVRDLDTDPAPQYPYRGTQDRQVNDRVFSPKFAPDLLPQADLLNRAAGGDLPNITSFKGPAGVLMRIPPLTQSPFYGLITGPGVANAVNLVPKNPDRWSIKVSNPGAFGNITFSFDAPVPLGAPPNVIGMGIVVKTSDCYQEFQGVSTNGIYVWCDAIGPTFPIPVVAYEGQLSVVGNQL